MTFKVTGIVTRGSMHLWSGIVQNLKMSTGTQNSLPVLKVIKSVKEDEYQYSKSNTGTQNPVPVLKGIKSVEEDEYQY